MANGISTGDVITREQRSELISDPSVTSVRTRETGTDDEFEVVDITFRDPDEAPTRTEQEEEARQREIETGDPRNVTEPEQIDVQPGRGPDTEAQVQSQLETVEQQLGQVRNLQPGRKVQIGGQTLSRQEAEQALQQRRQELEELEEAATDQRTSTRVEDAPITEGGLDVRTIAEVPAAETEPLDPETRDQTFETVRTLPDEFREDAPSIERQPEQRQDTIPDPIDIEEREQAQQIQQEFERQRRQREALQQFREADDLLSPSEIQARQRGEQLQETQQRREQVQQQIQQIEKAREQGVETVQINGTQVPISEAQEQLEQTQLELRATEDVQTQQVLETIDITEAPTRREAVQLETQRLRDLPTDELAARFAVDLAEFTGVSAAELGAETVTTAAGLGLGDEILDERRPEPDLREQFRDLTPSLLAAQERGSQIGARFSESLPEGAERQAAAVSTDVLGAAVPFGLPFSQLPQTERFAQTQIQRFPEALGAEVPEFATELGGSFAVAERTIEAPRETIATGATGAAQIAGQAADAPVEFFQTEIVPDVGLDIAAGSITPTVLPRAGEVVPDTQQVRDVFTNTRTGQLGTTATVDTVEPDVVTDVGPETPTPEPDIEVVEPLPPVEPQVEPVTEPTTEPVTQPEPVTAPAPVTEPVTRPDEVTTPGAVTEPVTEPVTQPISRPVAQPQVEPVTEPVVETRVQVQPRPQPQPQPQTRPRVVPRPDQDPDQVDLNQGLGVSDGGRRGTEVQPSLGAVFTGREQEVGEIREEFTGLEQRPIPIEDETGDVDDESEDVEQEISNLF